MLKKEKYSVKNEIEKALLRLMTKKSFMDISVTELVREAGVARVSFYRNFASISDVVDSIAEKAGNVFADNIPPVYSKDKSEWRKFLYFYFNQITIDPDLFLAADISNNPAVYKRVNAEVADVLENQPEPTMQQMYSWIGKLGLLNSVSKIWASGGMQESPEEMVDYVMGVIMNF